MLLFTVGVIADSHLQVRWFVRWFRCRGTSTSTSSTPPWNIRLLAAELAMQWRHLR